MNKLKAVIASLKKDMDGIDIDAILELYREEVPVADIADKLNRNPYEINKVLYALQLRRKKRHRAEDYRTYLLQLQDETGVMKNISEMQNEITYVYEKLDKAETNIQALKEELKFHKKARLRTHKDNALSSVLIDKLAKAVNQSQVITAFYKTPELPTGLHDNGLIAVYGDTHFGEVVKKDEVRINEYNYEIAKERIDKFIDSILTNPKQSNNLVLVDLKDTLKGVIHGGMIDSEGGFIQSITEAVKVNTYMLSVLSNVYNEIKVYSTGSNHDRLSDYIVSNGKYLDYGRLIDTMVDAQLKAMGCHNVEIITTNTGLHLIDVNGENIILFHGDSIRSYRPWDATQRGLLQDQCLALFGKPYKHSINGHGHQYVSCHNQYGGISLQNGTTVGSNAYGLQNGFRPIYPSQTILFVEQDGTIQHINAVDLR